MVEVGHSEAEAAAVARGEAVGGWEERVGMAGRGVGWDVARGRVGDAVTWFATNS